MVWASLSGKVAIVTGSRGTGRSIAERLAGTVPQWNKITAEFEIPVLRANGVHVRCHVPAMKARARIEAHGFLGLDDQTVHQINYWLRLSPAICMVWTAIGTALQSTTVLITVLWPGR
jgi:hypothetical protein